MAVPRLMMGCILLLAIALQKYVDEYNGRSSVWPMLNMSQHRSMVMRGYDAVVKATAWRDVIRLRRASGWAMKLR